MSQPESTSYRPEIDGLRAIAVAAVVLYHFGLPGLGGGFVGVDVFFVISGFLIGGILWNELSSTGHVDLKGFFIRRIRRLAPAFFAMAMATALVAYWILLPFEFRAFGKELIASTVWLSNVHFFREAGYFDIESESKLLLHTWSLAVEEQFYIALPLLLLALRSATKRAVITTLVALWAASLGSCLVATSASPIAAFYLFPFRAWEMLSGVLLAIWNKEAVTKKRLGPLVSWVGLLLILIAVVWVRPGSGFPGLQSLLPVVGAVLVILNGQDNNLINRALSARVPVFLGLISYSLYLWHWPVFALSNYWSDGEQSAFEWGGWLLMALVLATAAWACIERPARHRLSNKAALTGFASFCAFSLLIGASIYLSDGAPNRFGTPERTHIDASTSFYYDQSRCSASTDGLLQGVSVCTVGPVGKPEVLFWGDSHLRAMMGGVERAAQEAKTAGLLIWHAGCPPLFGVSKQERAATAAQDAKCQADTAKLHEALPELKDIRRIALVGRWTYYASGTGTGLDAHNRITLSPVTGQQKLEGNQQELYGAAWALTAQVLSKHFDEIFVFRQVPEMPRYSAADFAKRLVHGHLSADQANASLRVETEELQARTEQAEKPLMALASAGAIRLIDSWPRLCKPDCEVMQDGQSFYFDNNHLNTTGASSLRDLWLPVLKGAQSQ